MSCRRPSDTSDGLRDPPNLHLKSHQLVLLKLQQLLVGQVESDSGHERAFSFTRSSCGYLWKGPFTTHELHTSLSYSSWQPSQLAAPHIFSSKQWLWCMSIITLCWDVACMRTSELFITGMALRLSGSCTAGCRQSMSFFAVFCRLSIAYSI